MNKNCFTKKITPLVGKEIIVVTNKVSNAHFCLFKKQIGDSYFGNIPMRYTLIKNLSNFAIHNQFTTDLTIIFFQDGKKILCHNDNLNKSDFYKILGEFKLGIHSESFKVAFNHSTDMRFCKQYDTFKNTAEGLFIDILSGDPLFDTRNRFNSGTGWLSFYQAIDNSIIEEVDNSHGMRRIEVLAKISGIHLGHVFDSEIANKRRFCINATVLDFQPKI